MDVYEAPGSDRAWPHLARVRHRTALLDALDRAPMRAHLVVGDAGVGKSGLLSAVAEASPAREVVPVLALSELSGIPLGALAPALAKLGIPAEPSTAVGALVGVLGRAPERHLLLVDDAPRLDRLSAAVVYQLVRAFAVPTVLTARTGEVLPGPLARLDHEGLVDRRTLPGFSADEVAQLLESRFGCRADFDDVLRLTARSGGNALHLRVMVDAAVRAGSVHVLGDRVRIPEVTLPGSLSGDIAHLLGDLDRESREVLALVAMTQPIEPGVVGSSVASGTLLERFVHDGLLVRDPGTGLVRVAHPLVAEALGDTARRDPGQVGRAVGVLRAAGRDAGRFAACRLQLVSGSRPEVAEAAWAAQYALTTGDAEAASELAAAAMAAERERGGVRFATCLTAASALSTLGDLDAADAAFADAAGLASEPGELALLVARRGEHLAYRRFDVTAAVEQADAVAAGLPAATASAVRSAAAVWRTIARHGTAPSGPAAPGDWHDGPAVEVDDSASPEMGVRAAMAAVLTASMRGSLDRAEASAGALREIETRLGALEPYAAAMLGLQRYFLLLSHGDGDAAADYVQRQRERPPTPAVGVWTYTLAIHRMYGGRLEESARLAALAHEQLRWRDGTGLLGAAAALEAYVAAQRGDLDRSAALLAAMAPAARAEPRAALLVAECEAWLAASAGDIDDAVAGLGAAAERAIAIGYHLVAAISLGLCVRLDRVDDAATTLTTICDTLPQALPLYDALRDVAVALRQRDAAGILEPARRLARAGMAPTAADALLAVRAGGRNGEARRKIDLLVASIGAECEGRGLQDRSRSAIGLTARELQVAHAAAARERNREIADRLGVSVRTVENQLASVYRKLGIASRDELPAALRDTGIQPSMSLHRTVASG